MSGLALLNEGRGPKKSFDALLDMVSSPENILIDVVPDNCMKACAKLAENDGVVVDKGDNKPHHGGGYYLIEFCGVRRIKMIVRQHSGKYQVINDHHTEVLNGDEYTVIGRVLGSVQVRSIRGWDYD